MKIIPKFQRGGGFEALFTTYVPVQAPQQTRSAQTSQSERSSRQDSDDSKGKITEKDLLTMLKDIDGLPNEMQSIVTNLLNTFNLSKLTGIELDDLSSLYLRNLYKIPQIVNNKKQYDQAYNRAIENGTMSEQAITPDGRLVVQDTEGNIHNISLKEFIDNRDQYSGLTVSNLLNMRAFSPSLAFSSSLTNIDTVFDIVNNSMSYQSFQKLVKEAIQTLGTTQISRSEVYGDAEQASRGLSVLESLRDEEQQLQSGVPVTSSNLYTYRIINKNQKNQIDALTSYISALLPRNAKTWAALKLNTSNETEATNRLITTYLSSSEDITNDIIIQQSDSRSRSGRNSGRNSGEKPEDPKEGFWKQVQSGKGGEEYTYRLLIDRGNMSVDGKMYGAVPGITQNCSLGDYLANSKVGFITKDPKKITFGDIRISTDSFNDIMVNSSAGALVVKLPIDHTGQVNFDILEQYSAIQDELKKLGLPESSSEYKKKEAELLKKANLDNLIDQSTGLPNPRYFGTFLVLEGLTSGKAYGLLPESNFNKKQSFDDISSQMIINAGDDEQLYDLLRRGLSTENRGEYKIDNNWISFNNDTLYKGNIYVPISINPLSAMNADDNDVKESTALDFERDYQVLHKRINQGDIRSNVLQ